MYRRNEKAFEHDVRRFMSRNGHHIRNTPVWHNVPVRLFQLYLAVHERGGFEQVRVSSADMKNIHEINKHAGLATKQFSLVYWEFLLVQEKIH